MSEMQRRPAGTMSTERRYGIAISVALILGGVYWALTGLTEDEKTTHQSYKVEGTTLQIENSSADLTVRSGDVDEVKVDRTFDRNLFGSDPTENYEGGTLKFRDVSCGFLSFGCDAQFVVTVPKELPVRIESSSADVELAGLPAGGTVKTASGKIEVSDAGGELTLQTSSGRIEAKDLTATAVRTKTASGSIDLHFRQAPQSVDAQATSGDVTVQVPGTEAYKVESSVTSGDESITVQTDPASTRTIKAKTTSGDVTVEAE